MAEAADVFIKGSAVLIVDLLKPWRSFLQDWLWPGKHFLFLRSHRGWGCLGLPRSHLSKSRAGVSGHFRSHRPGSAPAGNRSRFICTPLLLALNLFPGLLRAAVWFLLLLLSLRKRSKSHRVREHGQHDKWNRAVSPERQSKEPGGGAWGHWRQQGRSTTLLVSRV